MEITEMSKVQLEAEKAYLEERVRIHYKLAKSHYHTKEDKKTAEYWRFKSDFERIEVKLKKTKEMLRNLSNRSST